MAESRTLEDQEVVSLIIANVGPKISVKGATEVRKKGIEKLLLEYHPSLILFQVFPTPGGFDWASENITKDYDYYGHNEASFGINKNHVRADETQLHQLKDWMIRKGILPMTMATLPRMHALIISTKGAPQLSFICVSWHGRYQVIGNNKLTQLEEELKYTLCLLQEFSENEKLPLIIAGDFNLPYKNVKDVLKSDLIRFKQNPLKGKKLEHDDPLVIYRHEPLRRKKESKMVDFYITSQSLKLRRMEVIDWDALDCECVFSNTFHHDPVFSVIRASDVEARNELIDSKKKEKREKSSRKKKSTLIERNTRHLSPIIAESRTLEDQEVVSLIIANVGPKISAKGATEVRKKGIEKLLLEYHPSLILFQEFPPPGGFDWASENITKDYDYYGHNEASFGINKNHVRADETQLHQLKDWMIGKGILPMTMATLSRMHALIISTKGAPQLSFICVSWHGRYKVIGNNKLTQLEEELKCTLCLLQKFSENEKLPLIIAGDFNLPYENAKKVLKSDLIRFKQNPLKGKKLEHDDPLVIYRHEPLRRKKESKMVDFYITSQSLKLRRMEVIDWDALDCECIFSNTFDHDPVFSVIRACDSEARNELV